MARSANSLDSDTFYYWSPRFNQASNRHQCDPHHRMNTIQPLCLREAQYWMTGRGCSVATTTLSSSILITFHPIVIKLRVFLRRCFWELYNPGLKGLLKTNEQGLKSKEKGNCIREKLCYNEIIQATNYRSKYYQNELNLIKRIYSFFIIKFHAV